MQRLTRSRLLQAAFLVEGGLVGLALVTGWLLGSPPFGSLRFRPEAFVWGALGACPLFLVLRWSMRWRWGAVQRLSRLLDTLVHSLFAEARLADLVVVSCLAGLGEEAFFRGSLQAALSERLGEWAALCAASFLFALAHLVTPAYACVAGIGGFYLGWLFLEFDNLLVPMLAHGLYDFLALVYVLRRRAGRVGECVGP